MTNRRRTVAVVGGLLAVVAAAGIVVAVIATQPSAGKSAPATAPTSTTTAAAAPGVCPSIQYGEDGTAGPLFCTDGRPDPPVLAWYQSFRLRVLALGSTASSGQVFEAMCADLGGSHPSSTQPIEEAAYTLAARINDWSFGDGPIDQMYSNGCAAMGSSATTSG